MRLLMTTSTSPFFTHYCNNPRKSRCRFLPRHHQYRYRRSSATTLNSVSVIINNHLDLDLGLLGALVSTAFAATYLLYNHYYIKTNYFDYHLFASPTPFNRFVFLRCPGIDDAIGTTDEENAGVVVDGRRKGGGGRVEEEGSVVGGDAYLEKVGGRFDDDSGAELNSKENVLKLTKMGGSTVDSYLEKTGGPGKRKKQGGSGGDVYKRGGPSVSYPAEGESCLENENNVGGLRRVDGVPVEEKNEGACSEEEGRCGCQGNDDDDIDGVVHGGEGPPADFRFEEAGVSSTRGKGGSQVDETREQKRRRKKSGGGGVYQRKGGPSVSYPGEEMGRGFVPHPLGRSVPDIEGMGGRRRKAVYVDNGGDEGVGVVYQRECVWSEVDGGVVSLDWPEELSMREEVGRDVTVVVVPGTIEGSGDRNVMRFVNESVNKGWFPIVVNPRGCAGSPVTTPRLFTAADSDDLCTAVQFINKARPWSTLMAVGWGLGANILTKYLAEVEEKTPLIAATCIDNPFDLMEATTSSSTHHSYLDQKLTNGLIRILQSNKKLFQGKGKRFDVEKALKATSLRDFDESISVASYGYESLEEFYSKSSTKDSMSKLKIPILFIQSDNETVIPSSVPRSDMAKNPYTSLLLCSSLSSPIITSKMSTLSWCQQISIEWLMAVEVALLKGRHPLLEDLDVTINPSKGLTLIENNISNEDMNINELPQFASSNGYSGSVKNMLDRNGKAPNSFLMSQGELSSGVQSNENRKSDSFEESSLGDAESSVESEDTPANNEESQVLQTTQTVMKMLDVTMPGTLGEEQKKKVLSAMEQGQSLMSALEGAVPEDVREKLTTAVSGILQTQGTKFNFKGILNIGQVTNVSSEVKSKIQEALGDFSGAKSEHQALEKSLNEDQSHPKNSDGGDISNSGVNDAKTLNQDSKADDQSSEKERNGNNDNMDEKTSDAADVTAGQDESKKENSNVEEKTEAFADKSKAEESPPPTASFPELPLMENSEKDIQKSEEKPIQPVKDYNKLDLPVPEVQAPPSVNVSQALDALTGFDDSTQVAVNSVFGVLENMITQLEENDQEKGEKQDENKNEELTSGSDETSVNKETEDKSKNTDRKNKLNLDSASPQSCSHPVNKHHEDSGDPELITTSHSKNEDRATTEDLVDFKPLAAKSENVYNNVQKFSLNPFGDSLYNGHLRQYLLSNTRNTKSLDLDSTADLLLDYIPEEGQWKLLDQGVDNIDSVGNIGGLRKVINGKDRNLNPLKNRNDMDDVIETSYVILDKENEHKPIGGYHRVGNSVTSADKDSTISKESLQLVRNIILEALKVEVSRRLAVPEIKEMGFELARDLENVADAVSLTVGQCKEVTWPSESKTGVLYGEHIISTISSAVMDARYLKKVLPVGVTVGSSLAALRKYYSVASHDTNLTKKANVLKLVKDGDQISNDQIDEKESSYKLVDKIDQNSEVNSSIKTMSTKFETANRDTVMAGAVTTALSASALFMHQQMKDPRSIPDSDEGNNLNEDNKCLDMMSVKSHSNIVSSLAEKAMSVAGPVVPTKVDGGLDQEKLVAMLADLGQRGGMLRLVGKLALLWGGIRGAISLTEKLISFLHLADRPLFQRVLGFACMVLVLWSPIVIPLFPTLVQGWTTRNSTGIAEYACVVGLYAAVTILIVLWGKRIRGYEDSIKQYGLDLTSAPKILDLFKGFMGGVLVILTIHSINVLLGCARFSWPSSLPSSSSDTIVWLKVSGKMLILTVRGIITATVVALVEELLFRSWLHEEIAVDLGYHWAVIFSGLSFAVIQCSLRSVPGLLLLSFALSGARYRSKGSLSVPIGLRSGIISASFILGSSGFVIYSSKYPAWLTGTHQLQPFGGVVGLTFCLTLAILLYPRKINKSLVQR